MYVFGRFSAAMRYAIVLTQNTLGEGAFGARSWTAWYQAIRH